MSMKREALVLYLQNVRDLEVAKEQAKRLYAATVSERDKLLSGLPLRIERMKMPVKEDFVQEDMGSYIITVLISGGVTGGFFLWLGHSLGIFGGFFSLMGFMIIVTFGLSIFVKDKQIEDSKREYFTAYTEYERYNQTAETKEASNRSKYDEVCKKYNPQIEFYKEEYSKIDKILNGFYSMNIIPLQFRDLKSSIYIYDFMSTSQATLEATLFHSHIEEGIQRLERKLDQIIVLVNRLIYETRCLRRENREVLQRQIDANNSMLENLRRIESNSADAATYSELASNYSKANAYFSLAEYLFKK